MNKWRYFYYPCQFGWHAALRRRNLLMSGVLAILLLIIAIFAEHWLVFFHQWLQYETNSSENHMDLTYASWLFFLQLLRFVLGVLTVGLIATFLWHCNHMYRFHLMGEEQQSLSIRLLLGQSPLLVTFEELFFVGIQSTVISLIGLVSGLWLSQKALQDFFHFFHLPTGFTFEFPIKGPLIAQLGVLLLLFLLRFRGTKRTVEEILVNGCPNG
ncbi:hypothetical protein [Enterococcus casseliflavus]|uniref:hypothetical protein n=1 Tax=Enterococcus TaxID=1350 RepID=UPI001E6571D6|nr:hypothetical protein [Enterococcus casseliflavus]MCD5201564.1 hypothetical protein [Enterococcus casseliflavus]MDT2986475.1 hypothetical protein [Enterococcus casseliflavus]MDV7752571.1 hypothetical protein [Enterococcus casseliflavus]WRO92951.1 hypothetical protein U8771_08050 [Enterococcus casseliflavus]